MTHPDYPARLAALRREIAQAGFDGFLVPMADEYQNEYVPACAQRIGFLSGFTGSAAYVVVLRNEAAFFTDSRYTLQAAQQVPEELFACFDMGDKMPVAWLEEKVTVGTKIAYDPWLHSAEGIERLKKALTAKGAAVEPVKHNFVDAVWADRPAPSLAPVEAYPLQFAGVSSADKRKAVAESLMKKNVAAALITDAASVAWLLNIRGGDVPNTPLPLSRVLLLADGRAQLFVDARKVTPGLAAHLGDDVAIKSEEDFPAALSELATSCLSVLVDSASASSWMVDFLHCAGARVETGDDPCEMPRAVKNSVELDGMRAAHRRDGAALARFFAWLEGQWRGGGLTELSIEAQLLKFRGANALWRGTSFDTIAGAGEHGAIVHYRATPESDAPLKEGQLLLLDSGGQYLDGTTDVTRTLALGTPSEEMRDRFTRVLKGHIALAAVRFPEGMTGADLDILARQPLWAVGLDYGHGTGHGVGCYLGVHEGPQAISRRSKVALCPGMVLSNEPGFYKTGAYGIRIENLQTVVKIDGLGTESRAYYGFEPLTLVPIDRRLIAVEQLTAEEIAWVDAYHARVNKELRPLVDAPTAAWLELATRPLKS